MNYGFVLCPFPLVRANLLIYLQLSRSPFSLIYHQIKSAKINKNLTLTKFKTYRELPRNNKLPKGQTQGQEESDYRASSSHRALQASAAGNVNIYYRPRSPARKHSLSSSETIVLSTEEILYRTPNNRRKHPRQLDLNRSYYIIDWKSQEQKQEPKLYNTFENSLFKFMILLLIEVLSDLSVNPKHLVTRGA